MFAVSVICIQISDLHFPNIWRDFVEALAPLAVLPRLRNHRCQRHNSTWDLCFRQVRAHKSQTGDDMGETWGDRFEILKERSVFAGWEFGCLSLWSN